MSQLFVVGLNHRTAPVEIRRGPGPAQRRPKDAALSAGYDRAVCRGHAAFDLQSFRSVRCAAARLHQSAGDR